jgi:predicted DsbA family dithiol-disulfide isomerase
MTRSTSDSLETGNSTHVIEVYADIWCPFAHVGLRSVFERRRELGRDDVAFIVRAWPLELVNGAPLDPSITAQHIEELREQVAPQLFQHFDPRHFPTTTLPALALVAGAYRQDARLGETVSFALRDALFERGCDVSHRDVLSHIGTRYGVRVTDEDRESVLSEWREGQARGVKGSPHFFCGATEVFCPSLDIARNTDGRLQIERNRAALDGFLLRCFGPSTASRGGDIERADLMGVSTIAVVAAEPG